MFYYILFFVISIISILLQPSGTDRKYLINDKWLTWLWIYYIIVYFYFYWIIILFLTLFILGLFNL